MHHRHARVIASLCCRGRGVGVALDKDRRRWPPSEDGTELLHHSADLGVTRLATYMAKNLRLRKTGRGEEDAGQFLIGMLPGVQQSGCFAQSAHD